MYQGGLSTVKISKATGLSIGAVSYRLQKAGVKMRSNKENSRRYFVNHDYFEVIDTEEKAYWLGLMYADGHVVSSYPKVGISLHIQDKHHLEKFIKCLDSNYPVNLYSATTSYGHTEYARIIITSEKMHKDLQRHGVLKHKSNILKFPTTVPNHLLRHFMRGYIDGDGCISKGNDWFYLGFVSTPEFIEGAVSFLEDNLGKIKYRTRKREEHHIVTDCRFNTKSGYEVLGFLWDNNSICLERKWSKCIEVLECFSHLYQK